MIRALNFLIVLGLLIALVGVSADYLLPGASPGVNPLQLLVIAAGFAVMILAALLRGGRSRTGRRFEHALAIALVTLFALEIVLAVGGAPVDFPADPANTALIERPWWTCGAAGCHYVYDEVQAACATGELKGRVCAINGQGYADSDDFDLPADRGDRTRILLIGDSFTWGMRAELGSSYAETLESAMPQALIWNTGIPGAGTNQAIMAFETYAPILRPHLTILGFYQNDFDDNLLPIDSWLNARDDNGVAFNVRKYAIDADENVSEVDGYTLGYLRAYGRKPPSNELERLLGSTRLGSLLRGLQDLAAPSAPRQEERFERRLQTTKQYLLELKQAVSSSASGFLVVLVPEAADIQSAGSRYLMAVELLRELEIPYLSPIGILDPKADYAVPDEHWNSSGHQKAGRLLSDCVERYFASGTFAECDHVTLH